MDASVRRGAARWTNGRTRSSAADGGLRAAASPAASTTCARYSASEARGSARERGCGDDAHAPRAVVLDRLHDLLARIHHEGAVEGDGFADGAPPEEEDLEVRKPGVLTPIGPDRERVTRAQHGKLSFSYGRPLGSDGTGADEHVDERVEVGTPGELELGVGRDGGVG